MKSRTLFAKNGILNLPGHHGIAAIASHVKISEWGFDTEFAISDCNRAISLELDYGKEDRDNTLFKLLAIKEVVDGLIEGHSSFCEEYDKFYKKKELKKEKKS